jgi:LPS-assembly protein
MIRDRSAAPRAPSVVPPCVARPRPRAVLVVLALNAALVAPAFGQDAAAGAPVPRLRLETELRESSLDADAPRPSFARGERTTGRANRETTLEGDAEIRRAGTVVRADRITLYEADDEVIAVGNVRVVREGQVFTGPQLQLSLDAQQGRFESPEFELPLTGGRGRAESVDFLGRGRVALTRAFFTSCRPDDPDWYLKAERLTLDRGAEEGDARSATLYFMDVPIFAAPYFGFPLGDERRSGFLAPTLSLTSTLGGEVRLPYYWNIAPNRDFTLFTNVTGRRGLQLGGIARYVEPTASGTTSFDWNPDDREAGRPRWSFSSLHSEADLYGWQAGWTLRGVSDDRYFIDYSRNVVQSADRSLPRDAFLQRGFGTWTARARVLQWQNILEARAAPPFDRLPQLTLSNTVRDAYGFDANLTVDATAFSRDLPGSAQGSRLIVNPSIAYPFAGASWFVIPRATLHATAYRLDRNPFGPLEIDRTVPTFSLDSGLIFERDTKLGSRDVIQTLEPRLFYVNTPFREQSAIPVFDAGVANFNLATLFSENTFVGGDRIADANQLTAGAVSRFYDPETGIESLRLAVAQRLYFSEQQVSIPGVPNRTDRRSTCCSRRPQPRRRQQRGRRGPGIGRRRHDPARRGVVAALAVARPHPQRRAALPAAGLRAGRHVVALAGVGPLEHAGAGQLLAAARAAESGHGTVGPVSPQLLEGVLGFEYLGRLLADALRRRSAS